MYVYVTYSVNFFKLFFFLFKSRFVWNLETLLITERGITDLYIWVFINQSWQNLIIHNLYTANVSSLVPDGVQDVREIQSFISNCTTIHFFHGNKFCIKVHCLGCISQETGLLTLIQQRWNWTYFKDYVLMRMY